MSKCIYLLVGRSGSGKSSVADYLESKYGWKILQSYTTRPPRYEGERGHTFISSQEFNKLKDRCAYTFFAGYEYCATTEQVENSDLYIIDPAGIEYFERTYKGTKQPICIFLDLSAEQAAKNLNTRKGASPEETAKRLAYDEVIFKDIEDLCDYSIQTDNLSVDLIGDIIVFINMQEAKKYDIAT